MSKGTRYFVLFEKDKDLYSFKDITKEDLNDICNVMKEEGYYIISKGVYND